MVGAGFKLFYKLNFTFLQLGLAHTIRTMRADLFSSICDIVTHSVS